MTTPLVFGGQKGWSRQQIYTQQIEVSSSESDMQSCGGMDAGADSMNELSGSETGSDCGSGSSIEEEASLDSSGDFEENEFSRLNISPSDSEFSESEEEFVMLEQELRPHILINDWDIPVIREFKQKYNDEVKRRIPTDSALPFNPSDDCGASKGEAINMINNVFVKHNVSDSMQKELYNTMHTLLPSIAFPLRVDTTSKHTSYPNNASAYIPMDSRDFKLDICRTGCMAFHGHKIDDNGVSVDCSKLLYCLNPKCKSQRFASKCKKCAHKPYESCDPFAKFTHPKKPHNISTRIPAATAYYRPIMGKLIKMYLLSLTDIKHKNILSYHKECNRVQRDGFVSDICDGEYIKDQINIMDRRHEVKAADYTVDGASYPLHSCPLLLTLFYDGKMNFKRKADSMWPLLGSIVNCNPSHRSKLGAGMFLVLLHNMADTGAEKYLMDELLVKELKELESGFVLVIPQENGNDMHVFFQARVVYAHVDTRALESVAKVKGAGSKCGCVLCNMQSGMYVASLKKCIYTGTRNGLPLQHALRFMGKHTFTDDAFQTRYYAGDEVAQMNIKEKSARVTLEESGLTKLRQIAYECAVNSKIAKSFPKPVTAPMKPGDLPRVWFNDLFGLELFQDKLYYPYLDTRVQVEYKRMTNADYIKHGDTAMQKEREYEDKLALSGRARPRAKKDHSGEHGVHGVCVLVRELEAFTFPSFCYDFMHYIANCGKYFFMLWKGERGLSDASRKVTLGLERFPELKHKKLLAPWQINQRDQDIVDAVMRSMLCPPAYAADHTFKQPMKQTGFMKFRDLLNFLLSYASYTLSFTALGMEYKNFTARFAFDLCSILNPFVSVEELEKEIIWSVYETRAIQEGLFPDSEMIFIFHEIIDIVHHVVKCGHVRSLTCYAGERALSTIAASVTKGGVHYIKTLYYRYIARERLMESDLDTKMEFTDNSGKYSDIALKLFGASTPLELSVAQINRLYERIYIFVLTQGIPSIELLSPFFRLFTAFKYNRDKAKSMQTQSGFCSWIKELSLIYKANLHDMSAGYYSHKEFSACVCGDIVALYTPKVVYVYGTLYMSDFILLVDSIMEFKPSAYVKAVVKGIVMSGCGTSVLHGELNDNWSDRRLHSCWIRFSDQVHVSPKSSLRPDVKAAAVEPTPLSTQVACSSIALPHQLAVETSASAKSVRVEKEVDFQAESKRPRRDIPVSNAGGKNDFIYSLTGMKKGEPDNSLDNKSAPPVTSRPTIPDVFSSGTTTNRPPIVVVPAVSRPTGARYAPPGFPTFAGNIRSTTAFGQSEVFFRVLMSEDPVVNGLAFSLVNVRKTVYCPARWHYYVPGTDDADINVKEDFICLNHVDSTAIRLSAINADNKPMIAPGSKDSQNIRSSYWASIYASKKSRLNKLFLIETHPERLRVQYSSIYPDIDGTKIFEC